MELNIGYIILYSVEVFTIVIQIRLSWSPQKLKAVGWTLLCSGAGRLVPGFPLSIYAYCAPLAMHAVVSVVLCLCQTPEELWSVRSLVH